MTVKRAPIQIACEAAPLLSEGTRRLWLAALEGARTDLQLAGSTHWSHRPKRSVDFPHPAMERAWFQSSSDRTGSFLWICRALGLDPDYWRRGLMADSWSPRDDLARANDVLRREARNKQRRRTRQTRP